MSHSHPGGALAITYFKIDAPVRPVNPPGPKYRMVECGGLPRLKATSSMRHRAAVIFGLCELVVQRAGESGTTEKGQRKAAPDSLLAFVVSPAFHPLTVNPCLFHQRQCPVQVLNALAAVYKAFADFSPDSILDGYNRRAELGRISVLRVRCRLKQRADYIGFNPQIEILHEAIGSVFGHMIVPFSKRECFGGSSLPCLPQA